MHSAPRYLTPAWASSCHGAPDAAVISNTGGNLKRHSCQTQSPKQELLIGLASFICLIPAVSILRKQVSSSLPEPYLASHRDRDGECLQTQERGSEAGSQKIEQE